MLEERERSFSADDPDEQVRFEVQVTNLANHVDPLDGSEWDCDPIDPADVLQAVAERRFEAESWQVVNARCRARAFDEVKFHVQRIAYLMENPDEKPLIIEIEEYLDRKRLRMYDGSHRFAAAMLRGDVSVTIAVDAWAADKLLEMLPDAITLTEDPNVTIW